MIAVTLGEQLGQVLGVLLRQHQLGDPQVEITIDPDTEGVDLVIEARRKLMIDIPGAARRHLSADVRGHDGQGRHEARSKRPGPHVRSHGSHLR